ncbi:MAG: Gx transporter family protein [Firmicutes bacterium]|nr:Gx transporter family protein [Bacillota bacterium]
MPSQTNCSKHNRQIQKTRLLAIGAMFACLALIFSYIEAIIPFNAGIPGVKLGIANLVVIIALYNMGPRYAFTINCIRILVAGLLFNGAFGAVYSLAGGMLSFLVMWVLKKTNLFSMVGVSMAGGVAHNMGQLLVASAIVSNLKMFLYFPVLMFSGLASGIMIGVVACVIDSRVPKQLFR